MIKLEIDAGARARRESERIETNRKEEERKASEYTANLREIDNVASKYLLTSSAEAYVSSLRKELSDYTLKSVDAFYAWTSGSLFSHVHKSSAERLEIIILECKKQMIEKAKKLGAEVVVDIKPNAIENDQFIYLMMGTALIPKKYEK